MKSQWYTGYLSFPHILRLRPLFMILLLLFLSFFPYEVSRAVPTTPTLYSNNHSLILNNSFQSNNLPAPNSIYVLLFILLPLFIILFILFLYVMRHCSIAVDRLFGSQDSLYSEIIEANWPSVTLLVPAHNEETVIADLLASVIRLDYPRELLQVIIVNDRSTDKTGEIVEDYVQQYGTLFYHFDRKTGTPGKSAALFDVMPLVKNSITLVFDADYIPEPYLIKQLVVPFFDPEVGAVMGRVIAGNVDKNLLTRLIDLERTGGYQVNQKARENWRAVPQYGGTAGGLRNCALRAVGGWEGKILAEDTEVTFRLLENHWLTIYQNNAECLELVPETWAIRIKQIKRWAKGHNQVMFKYFFPILFNTQLNPMARYDGLLLLMIYIISPLLLVGWLLYILAYLLGVVPGASGILGFLLIIAVSGVGNFTIFYEIAIGLHLDNLKGVRGRRIRLLPFIYLSFFVSMFVISMAFLEQITVDLFRKSIIWERTHHPSRKRRTKRQ